MLVPVSVGDVLEVRDRGLQEQEIWAMIAAAVPAIQSKARIVSDGVVFGPENIFVESDGTVTIEPQSVQNVDHDYVPLDINAEHDNAGTFVYSLGSVLMAALEFSGAQQSSADEAVSVSADLLSLLNLMTVNDPKIRPALGRLGQMASQQLAKRNCQVGDLIRQLNLSIMGDEADLELSIDSFNLSEDLNDEPVHSATNSADIDLQFDSISKPEPNGDVFHQIDDEFVDDFEIEDTTVVATTSSQATEHRANRYMVSAIEDIGSPVGNSTAIDNSRTGAWVDFESSTPRAEESAFSSSADELGVSRETPPPNTDPFAYSELQESSAFAPVPVPAPRDVFVSQPRERSLSEKAPVSITVSSTPPKEHVCRSCHSLNCQFCSPQKPTPKPRGSLPNLNTVPPETDEHRTDPFASFDDLANIDKEETSEIEEQTEEKEIINETTVQAEVHEPGPAPVAPPRKRTSAVSTPSAASIGRNGSIRSSASSRTSKGSGKPPVALVVTRQEVHERLIDGSVPLVQRRSGSGRQRAAQSQHRVSLSVNLALACPARSALIAGPNTRRVIYLQAMGGPEFLYKSRLPSIRLKAPAIKRRKLLQRSEASSVQVVLLNGQRVEVACRTDCAAGDVFDLVVTHTNLNEHIFFGLTILKDGEHFFLERDQKLHKFAPPGWKQQKKQPQARSIYTLYLRLKFYPTTLDFIRTEHTLHEMYLQLRRDVIDERMQTNRDSAFQLAALALQAEHGDRPAEDYNYFEPDHYLPHRFLLEELSGQQRIRTVLAELHSQYAGMVAREAEAEYLKMCQSEKEYGIHFHRLYRTKPSLNLGNTPLGDPDTGTPLWIGIMPRGIIVFEEKRGERAAISQHPWQKTQTLQFDKKRFIIVVAPPSATPDQPGTKVIFFTDNYKKSSYFVKFSQSQHRFCMKMRSWAYTLATDPAKRTIVDPSIGAGRLAQSNSLGSAKSADSGAPDLSREASPDDKLNARQAQRQTNDVLEVSVPSNDRTLRAPDESVDASLADRLDRVPVLSPLASNDYSAFTVRLIKDPSYGLGLTLVDGEIQGMKGVYVKSLTTGGPADLQGRLKVGDKLVSVNGESLNSKNRHDAVMLVKQSPADVEMEIMRLRGLSSSNESLHALTNAVTTRPRSSSASSVSASSSEHQPAARASTLGRPRATTSPEMNNSSTLPSFKSEDIVAYGTINRSPKEHRKTKSVTLPANLNASAIDKDPSNLVVPALPRGVSPASNTSSMHASMTSSVSSRSSGEFALPQQGAVHITVNDSGIADPKRPVSAGSSKMYSGYFDSDSEEEHTPPRETVQKKDSTSSEEIDYGEGLKANGNVSREPLVRSVTLDWAQDLDMDMAQPKIFDSDEEHMEEFYVTLEKNDKGSLGIKIAGDRKSKNCIYIKALVANPALNCSNLRPGDKLISVNEQTTRGLSHQDVVDLLRNASTPVTLGLKRLKTMDSNLDSSLLAKEDELETLEVRLEKPSSGSLGLSLAKLTGGEGIYIRVISEGSVADQSGTLRVGDRLWQVNGESVAEASPLEVVEKLKAAQGYVTLIVKREKRSALY